MSDPSDQGRPPGPPPPPPGFYPPPQYRQAQHQYPPQYQPRPVVDHTTRNVLLGVFGGLGLLFVVGAIVVAVIVAAVFSQAASYRAGAPSDPVPYSTSDPTPTPKVTTPTAPTTTPPTTPTTPSALPSLVELTWKAGGEWLTPPPSKSISRFTAKYDKPASFLKSLDKLPDGFTIVITNDKKYNCGWTLVSQPNYQVGGCYRSEYGKTLFLYWGKYATDSLKELVVLHEMSHFYQQWYHFDAVTSAYSSKVSASTLKKIIETDATCRVYDEWHYTKYEYLDDSTSAPCGTTKWSSTWMQDKFVKAGVTITNW